MTNAVVILGMLQQLQPYHMDAEAADARQARLEILADSISWASERATCTGTYATDESCVPIFNDSSEKLAVALFTVGKWESYSFAEHVHADRCRVKIGECDGGRSKSVFQVHMTAIPRYQWAKIGGKDLQSTRAAAWAAATIWSRAWKCGTPERAFTGYARSRCRAYFPQATSRAKDYRRYLQVYAQLDAEQEER